MYITQTAVSEALVARRRHTASHAPIRGYDTHSFSSMAAAGEGFIDLCLGRLGNFGWDVSLVSGKFHSVADKVCRTRDGLDLAARADCKSLILSCEGTLRRNCTSSCVYAREHTDQLIYFLFRQYGSAVYMS